MATVVIELPKSVLIPVVQIGDPIVKPFLKFIMLIFYLDYNMVHKPFVVPLDLFYKG